MNAFKWLMIWAIVATVCLTICYCVLNWPVQTMHHVLHEIPSGKQSSLKKVLPCQELPFQHRCKEYAA